MDNAVRGFTAHRNAACRFLVRGINYIAPASILLPKRSVLVVGNGQHLKYYYVSDSCWMEQRDLKSRPPVSKTERRYRDSGLWSASDWSLRPQSASQPHLASCVRGCDIVCSAVGLAELLGFQ